MMTPSCILHRMSWPKPVQTLWGELEDARAALLREIEGLSQQQMDWRPAPSEWSIGEVVDHLTVAEVATGKLTTKLTKEAAAGGAPTVFPHDVVEFAALPVPASVSANAPDSVWPTHGKPITELLATLKATRERTRQSFDRLAACDPRALRFKHFRLGELDLAQWWRLAADHDRVHVGQVLDIKRAPGFPAG
jgi:DinB superfamily